MTDAAQTERRQGDRRGGFDYRRATWVIVLGGLVVLALMTLAYAIQHRSLVRQDVAMREAAIRSCKRVNDLRVESNERIAAHLIDRDVLAAYLRANRELLRQSGGGSAIKEAIEEHTVLLRRLEEVTFDPVDVPNCPRQFPK